MSGFGAFCKVLLICASALQKPHHSGVNSGSCSPSNNYAFRSFVQPNYVSIKLSAARPSRSVSKCHSRRHGTNLYASANRDCSQIKSPNTEGTLPSSVQSAKTNGKMERTSPPLQLQNVLLIGYGRLGKDLARELKSSGIRVLATTTNKDKAGDMKKTVDEVIAIPSELSENGNDEALKSAIAKADGVFIAVGPPKEGYEDYMRDLEQIVYGTVLRVVKAMDGKQTPTHVGFVSSCAAYGTFSNGEVVDEDTPAKDPDARAQVVLKAEQALMDMQKKNPTLNKVTIFRCQLLWSLSRGSHDLFLSFYAGKRLPAGLGDDLMGITHHDDIINGYLWCMRNDIQGIVNVASPAVPRKELFNALCGAHGLPQPEWDATLPFDASKLPRGRKTVVCKRLIESGYRFRVLDAVKTVAD